MDTAGLTKDRHGVDYVPSLLAVRCTRWLDKVTVKMLPGQRIQDYVDVADRLAQTFGAHDCRVRSTRSPHRVQLWLLVRDPLDAVVSSLPARRRAWRTGCRSPSPRTARRGCCGCSGTTC